MAIAQPSPWELAQGCTEKRRQLFVLIFALSAVSLDANWFIVAPLLPDVYLVLPLASDSTLIGSTSSDRSSAISDPPISCPSVELIGESDTGVRERIHAQLTCLESIIAPEGNIPRIESRGRLRDGPM